MIPTVPQQLHEGGREVRMLMTEATLKAAEQGGRLVVIAENQPEYVPLVASVDTAGMVMTEWQLTDDERATLAAGGRIRLWVHTFNTPMQPVMLEAVANSGRSAGM